MNAKEWRDFILGTISGVERHLSRVAPKSAGLQLTEIHEQVKRAKTARARKSCERELDNLGESTPYFRGAVRRHIGEQMDIAIDKIENATKAMIKLARVSGKHDAANRISKSLRKFRKNRQKPIYKPLKHSRHAS